MDSISEWDVFVETYFSQTTTHTEIGAVITGSITCIVTLLSK